MRVFRDSTYRFSSAFRAQPSTRANLEFAKDFRQREDQIGEQWARVRTGDVELGLAGAFVGVHASRARIDVEDERDAPCEIISNLRIDVALLITGRPNLHDDFGRYSGMLHIFARQRLQPFERHVCDVRESAIRTQPSRGSVPSRRGIARIRPAAPRAETSGSSFAPLDRGSTPSRASFRAR